MFIGVCGSICAGKSTVAQYLVDHHGFTQLYVSDQRLPSQKTTTNGADTQKEQDSVETQSTSIAAEQANNRGLLPQRRKQHVFATADELLEFVTQRWRERWVTDDIFSEAVLDMYARRPFFLLISVDAPLTVRWRRYCNRPNNNTTTTTTTTTLEKFALLSDDALYSTKTGLLPLISRATVRLLNTSDSLAHLYATLGTLDLLNPDRLRPSWDSYFMSLASLAAQRSNCMKRRVGCVVVRDKRVVSTGYNGTPRGLRNCGEGGCGRCNEGQGSGHGLATCLCIHAEENALLEAGRERLRDGNAVLYCDTCPCLTCSIKIVQVGVSEVVYSQGYSMDGETAAVFREAGVRLRQFVPPAKGLIHLEKLQLY
ncbi:cytidine deaminase-like protein [Apodospora peruviana]|uniref:Deoxycytidylate deaminase n=1 Tax=Apodospora peruviana TaxID=516989 RepID=A0AAE0MBQ4_9PEZI|nr:cytidine deaminase-like protein [Apodospora peruviana]